MSAISIWTDPDSVTRMLARLNFRLEHVLQARTAILTFMNDAE